jgi:hypothetical protein
MVVTFADADLWQLGLQKNWSKLRLIPAPLKETNTSFGMDLKCRLLIDDIRQRFDTCKDSRGFTILTIILCTNAADRKQTANVARLVFTLRVIPDLPANNAWTCAHSSADLAVVQVFPTTFASSAQMTALNIIHYNNS